MTGQAAGPVWPSAWPPPADTALAWELSDVSQLPQIRAELRRHATRGPGPVDPDLLDQLVLALDEMASNSVRHGRGRVHAAVRIAGDCYLIEVSDQAASSPPAPAVGRDPSLGGLGLYLIAELSTQHGWYVRDERKFVWAMLPRS